MIKRQKTTTTILLGRCTNSKSGTIKITVHATVLTRRLCAVSRLRILYFENSVYVISRSNYFLIMCFATVSQQLLNCGATNLEYSSVVRLYRDTMMLSCFGSMYLGQD